MSKKVVLPLLLFSLGVFSATCTVGCGSSTSGGGTGGAGAGGRTGGGGMVTGTGGAAAGGRGGSTDAGAGGNGVGGAATDGGTDVHADTSVDVTQDVPADVHADVPADVPADVHADVPADVPVDVPADVAVDVTVDTGNPDVSPLRTYQVPLIPIPGIPSPSTGSGMATVMVNTATGLVSASGNFTGLTTNTIMPMPFGHIHDNTTAVVITFTVSAGATTAGTFTGSMTLTPAQITSLTTTGLWYVNIHTGSNPAGEIRGYIL